MRDFDRTIISQYTNSATLCQLITNLNTYIDPNANLQNFYDLIWNVDTAEGYGLDVWGRIVGISRNIQIPDGKYFGFAEATKVSADPFEQSPFYDGQRLTTSITLTDEQYRLLIFAKAAANITDNSIPAVNQILMNLFPNRGNAYVLDGRNSPHDQWFGFAEASDALGFDNGVFGDLFNPIDGENMSLIYVFEFTLDTFEKAIVDYSRVLPKGVGVSATAQYP